MFHDPVRTIPVASLGPWSALTVAEVNALFREACFRWWVVGGWAIDLFIGRQTRPHQDIEVAILRRDAPALHEWLAHWQLWYVPAVGQCLRSWLSGEPLPTEAHEIWARRTTDGPWELEVLIEEADADRWFYRRDARRSRPLADYGITRGVRGSTTP